MSLGMYAFRLLIAFVAGAAVATGNWLTLAFAAFSIVAGFVNVAKSNAESETP